MTQTEKDQKNAIRVHARALSMLSAISDATLYQSWDKEDLDNMAEAALTLLDQANIAAQKTPDFKYKLNYVFSNIFENLLIWRDEPALALKMINSRMSEKNSSIEKVDTDASLFFVYAYIWKFHDQYSWERQKTYNELLKIYVALAPMTHLLSNKKLARLALAWYWLDRPELASKIIDDIRKSDPDFTPIFVEPVFWLDSAVNSETLKNA